MGEKSIETGVGLFVVLGFAALLFLALRVSGLGLFESDEGYELVARFDAIGGLKTRAPVKLAGVGVGRVAAIELDKADYRAVVRMRLSTVALPLQRVDEEGRRMDDCAVAEAGCVTALYGDASASIFTAGLLGEQYVALEPGGGAPGFLRPGDEVGLTQSAVILERLIGQFLFDKAGQRGAP